MKLLAFFAVFLGAAISLAPNTTGDSIAGAVMLIGGLVGFFWPMGVHS